jgi:hypothetical protein
MIKKCVARVAEFQAVQFDGSNGDEIKELLPDGHVSNSYGGNTHIVGLSVRTSSGFQIVTPGQVIVYGPDGHVSVLSHDAFEANFSALDDVTVARNVPVQQEIDLENVPEHEKAGGIFSNIFGS